MSVRVFRHHLVNPVFARKEPIPSDNPADRGEKMKVIFIGNGKGLKVHATKFKPTLMTAPSTYCGKSILPEAEFEIGSVSEVTCKSCLKALA